MAWNTEVFEAVQALTGISAVDSLMMFLAEYLVVLIPLSLIYLWFQDREGKNDSSLVFAATLTGIATAYIFSIFYSHQNPSVTYNTIIAADPSENAFPSHHTTTVFSAAFALMIRKRKQLGYLMLVAAVVTGFARIYVGEHWPVDILGAVVASLSAVGVAYYGDRFTGLLDPVYSFSEKIEKEIESRFF
jgi:undecaprenyl-diphosphatase